MVKREWDFKIMEKNKSGGEPFKKVIYFGWDAATDASVFYVRGK